MAEYRIINAIIKLTNKDSKAIEELKKLGEVNIIDDDIFFEAEHEGKTYAVRKAKE